MSRAVDVAVIGAGPAGVACALELTRHGIDVWLFDSAPVGGLLRAARRIDNLPGFPGGVSGAALARRFARHIRAAGLDVVRRTVTALAADGARWSLVASEIWRARAVVIAAGSRPVDYPVPGWHEAEAAGRAHRDVRGLPHRCAHCAVAVVGGGDVAFDSALTARDRGAQAAVFMRGASASAASILVREAAGAAIEVRPGFVLRRIDLAPSGLRLSWRSDSGERVTRADHLLACVGREPRRDWLAPAPGLFAAGDCRFDRPGGAAAAMGDGQRAATEVVRFLLTHRSTGRL